jgi:hypothetical protein
MRCNGTINEPAGTRIAAFASSRAPSAGLAADLSLLPILLLLTSP